MRRRIIAVAAVSAVALTGLVGCSSAASSEAFASCSAPLSPGMLSNGVQLDSMQDGIPSVTITGGTDIFNPQLTVLSEGDRVTPILGGEIVTAGVTVFDAASGAMVIPTQTRFLEAMPQPIVAEFTDFLATGATGSLSYTDLIMAGVICSAPGDVLSIAVTPEQAFTSGYSEDALIVIVDVLSAGAMQIEGATQPLPWGFPALASDDTGRPGIVLPPQAAPTEVRVATAITGNGTEVTPEGYIIGNLLTVGWDGEQRSNSWDGGGIVEFGAEGQSPFPFRAELSGIPVGSRVVILDPNDGNAQVHVVDILAAG